MIFEAANWILKVFPALGGRSLDIHKYALIVTGSEAFNPYHVRFAERGQQRFSLSGIPIPMPRGAFREELVCRSHS